MQLFPFCFIKYIFNDPINSKTLYNGKSMRFGEPLHVSFNKIKMKLIIILTFSEGVILYLRIIFNQWEQLSFALE